MRLALLVVLCGLPLSALAEDQASCAAKCSDQVAQCSKGCKDEKCLGRCVDRSQSCQSGCSAARPAKVPKGEDGRDGTEKDPLPPKGNMQPVKPPR
ncbi:MAG: hypothetical protein ACYC8T_09910 [Myxococcaceae bacterium]